MSVIYKFDFKVGDRVSWTSQANGIAKKKTGVVVEVVAFGRLPAKISSLSSRSHESYVVSVSRVGRKGPLKPELYWPVRSLLRPVGKASSDASSDAAESARAFADRACAGLEVAPTSGADEIGASFDEDAGSGDAP